jgi:hypothetical protein
MRANGSWQGRSSLRAGSRADRASLQRDEWQFLSTNASRSTIPFESLGVTIEDLVRHPDPRTVEFTVVLSPRNLDWQSADDGKCSLDLLVVASLNGNRDFLASRGREPYGHCK